MEENKQTSTEVTKTTLTNADGYTMSKISFWSAIVAIFIMFVGAPLINRKSGGFINGSGWGNNVDLWKRYEYNIYDDEKLILVGVLILIFTIIAGLIAFSRKDKDANGADLVAVIFNILNCMAIFITGSIAFYDDTDFTYGGGLGVMSGESQSPTFWFVIIALLLFLAAFLSIASLVARNKKQN